MTTDIEATLGPLLQPLPQADPCGPSMRSDPVFTEIRLAREEDDASLPMRQWERPLKKADWALIEERCTSFLSRQTKDVQLAAWLLESWTRQTGWAGLEKGLCLLRELLVRFWDGVHPRIDEDGDSDARVAPLQWLNESLPLTIKVHVPLVLMGDRKPPRIALADWDRLTAAELAAPGTAKPAAAGDPDGPVTRAEVLATALSDRTGRHAKQLVLVRESAAHLLAITQWLDERLGRDAPNLHKLRATLEALERVLLQFQPIEVPAPAVAEETMPTPDPASAPEDAASAATVAPILTKASVAGVRLPGVQCRDDANEALEALAKYLGQIEPLSPTPYLIRRAVNWGRMPLPELMQEILREEGDLNRMTTLLGLNREG
jgi:type VI secretion system protein ImpA